MTLLNPPQIVPEILPTIVALIAERADASRTWLSDVASPTTLREGHNDAQLQIALGALDSLGLVEEREGVLVASEAAVGACGNREAWRMLVLEQVADRSARGDDPYAGPTGDLALALAWLSMVNPASGVPEAGGKAFELSAEEHEPEQGAIVNPERWPPLVRWVRSLDLAAVERRQTVTVLVLDATWFVRKVLERREFSQPTPAEVVLASISDAAPWLEGRLADAERERLRASPDRIAPGLALALLRLEREGFLVLENLADAQAFTLRAGDGPRKPVSHLRQAT